MNIILWVLKILIVFIIGLIFGSFANVLIYRIPLNQSIIFPFSYCPRCFSPIKWYDNIPLISYILLKGRCRVCNEKISITYPLVELFCGLIAVGVYLKHIFSFWPLIQLIIFFNLLFVLLVISFIDIKTQQIPDVLSYYTIFFGVVFSLDNSLLGERIFIKFSNALIGGIVGFLTGYTIDFLGRRIFRKPSLGGGDIKLFCGIGTYLGYTGVFKIIFLSSLIASVYAVLSSVVRKEPIFGKYLPFAPFICIATILYVLTK